MTKGNGAGLDRGEIVKTIEKLKGEHADLKKRVQELYERPYLSPEEQMEAKTLQKMKLLKKDAIAALEAKLGA